MAEKKDFETNLKELEQIVERLEKGDTTLDESIKFFEKGMKISVNCRKVLDSAKQKINDLTRAEKEEEKKID